MKEANEKDVYSCGLEAALAVIGGKWKFLVLWNLAGHSKRFGELRRLVVGISEKMLIQGLKEMEIDGIVRRKDFRQIPPRVESLLDRIRSNACGFFKTSMRMGHSAHKVYRAGFEARRLRNTEMRKVVVLNAPTDSS